jgi:uncharacterized protein YkwD
LSLVLAGVLAAGQEGGAEKVERKRAGLEPSASEQALIYLINRARHDPPAYGKALGLDLSAIAPAPPLAMNHALTASARFRASDMAKRNYFDHVDPDGVGPNWHALESGYLLGRNYDRGNRAANNIESINAGADAPDRVLAQLIIDRGDPNGGHRSHLLGADKYSALARDIGVGLARAAPGSRYRAYTAIHLARTDERVVFITGVVYRDRNSNRIYDAGEGLKGIAVSAGDANTTTTATGGFAIPTRPGTMQVVCEKGTFGGRATAEVQVSDNNVHVEFLAGKPAGIVDFGKR